MNPEKFLLVSFIALLTSTGYNTASEVEDFKPEDHVKKPYQTFLTTKAFKVFCISRTYDLSTFDLIEIF
jgi:hypothetical protein